MTESLFEVPANCPACGRTTDPFTGCGWCNAPDETWVFAAPAPCPAPHATGSTCVWCETSGNGNAAGRKGAQKAVDADPEFAYAANVALIRALERAAQESKWEVSIIDVRNVLGEMGVEITRPQALGSVMTNAAAAGLIRKTNRTFPSPIKGQHGRDIRVWELVA